MLFIILNNEYFVQICAKTIINCCQDSSRQKYINVIIIYNILAPRSKLTVKIQNM